MSIEASADARVLGQLLLAQSVVTSLPDGAIIPFVIQALSDVPGVGRVEFDLLASEGENNLVKFHLASGSAIHGELAFEVMDAGAFEPYFDHIRNFTFMLAIILEERRQRRVIEEHQQELERQVEERTGELSRERDMSQRYLDVAGVMLMAIDSNGRIMMINKKGAQLLGKSESALLGSDWVDGFISEEERGMVREVFSQLMRGETHLVDYVENHIVIASGERRMMAWHNTLLKNEQGFAIGILSSAEDITERKRSEDRIERLAFYDPLTELPNRRLLLDRLQRALTASARHHRFGALLMLDMDDFKTLNDTLGHDVGDKFLMEVANRLQMCVREGDTVARQGGDEFVIILEDLNEDTLAAMQVESIAMKILRAVSEPYLLDLAAPDGSENMRSYHCTSSIGIALFRGNDISADELIRRADTAMYQVKASDRNSIRFFDPEMQDTVNARAALDNDLREAMRARQFLLHYQPQVDAKGRMTGVEALLRWRHPLRGVVYPAQFISQAEVAGLIIPLGHWVLKTACRQLVAWDAQPGMPRVTMAVNVSARQFRQPNFADRVLAVIDSTGVDPKRLKLELTESLLLEDVEDVIAKMTALKARGVGFALDDFGTGYSSLSYLRRLPLDQMKIDQSFVRDALIDPNDATIARTIVALAQSMGLAVIAEGVETEAQREFLAGNGCQAYQGSLFSRPLPVEDVEAFARRAEEGLAPSVKLHNDGCR